MKALLLVLLLSGCALTDSNRFTDRAQAAQADLYSPAMNARIAAAVHP